MKSSVKILCIRSAAEKYEPKRPVLLCRYVKQAREHGLENFQFGYNIKRQIFSDAQELQLQTTFLKLPTSISASHQKKCASWHMNLLLALKSQCQKCGKKTSLQQVPTGSRVY